MSAGAAAALAAPGASQPGPAPLPILQVDGVTHLFGGFRALDDVSLAVQPNEIAALLGPSGCGKSTLLRAIAGFVRQARGEIRIGGRVVDRLPPGKRSIGIVFQNYALFPHLSAFENVAYGLRARGVPGAEVATRARAGLDTVRMLGFADRMPRQLSGGQQQRIALARALVTQPKVILLDEPFAALDKNLRIEMQAEIKRLQRERGLTAILVTHDQDEAMSVADRIAVMHHGRIEQVDSPAGIYDRPATLFVNSFVGAANLLHGTVAGHAGGRCIVDVDAGATLSIPGRRLLSVGRRVVISVRPEHLALFATPAPDRWPVTLRGHTDVGGVLREEMHTADGTELTRVSPRVPGRPAPADALVDPLQDAPLSCGLCHADCANIFEAD